MLGLPGGSRHFGLTRDPERPLEPAPAVDDLFVLPLLVLRPRAWNA
ncbi:hypothetical protein [Actinacidiphila glaucinigra]